MSQKITEWLSALTLEEKAGLCSGENFWWTKAVERLGIPAIMMTDGPHGLRKQEGQGDHLGLNESVPATCFPSAAGLASSWNRELISQVGEALGKECQAEGVSILLGPGANIKRSPLCGRNFEYFSEDPYLTGELAASHILGVQSQGVGTSLKHFAVNNQEHRRMTTDAVVDERTLREIYLTGFEIAVKKAQPWTIMSAYNKLNGAYCSENKQLLSNILQDEWGHEGFVVSDWGAVNEAADSVAAGLSLEMPASHGEGQKKIVNAVATGQLSEQVLDQVVERLLHIVSKAIEHKKQGASYDKEKHHQLARATARETMVLLKNEDNILPLAREGKIAVIGAMAEHIRYQGGGSSHVKPTKLDNALSEIKKLVGSEVTVEYADGYLLDKDDSDEIMLHHAKSVAKQSDVVIVFAGLPDRYESEAYDRQHMNLPKNHIELIEQLADVQPNLVVVLSNGAPIVMPWLDKVKGVLEAYLGGQGFGGAIADLLFGEANPSGKLAETFPVEMEHNPSHPFFPGEGDKVDYREGVFVGYRYYEAKKIAPLFPFGYGLSYTTFVYSELVVDKDQATDQEQLQVSLTVKNTGSCFGQEVVQLYTHDKSSANVVRPLKELKGFSKISLAPGEEKQVSFTLDKRSFAYYSVELQDWYAESGEYEILIGSSSADIRLRTSVYIHSTVEMVPSFHRNTTLGELMENPKTAPILSQLQSMGSTADAQPSDAVSSDMMMAMMRYMPIRALLPFTQGAMTEQTLKVMLEQFNQAVQTVTGQE